MTPVKCIIIDDEPLAVNLLTDYVQAIPYLQLAGCFYNALDALSFLRENETSIILLDINLPRLNGMDLSRHLDPKYKIIFVTAYSEYAVESYERAAIDYLLKPVTFDRFLKAVNKALDAIGQTEVNGGEEKKEDFMYVKSGKTILQLFYEHIYYIEGLKDYVAFHTHKGKYIVYKRMKELEETLPTPFMRIHNSYIVNNAAVQKIADHQVLIRETWLPVSEKYRLDFYEAIRKRVL